MSDMQFVSLIVHSTYYERHVPTLQGTERAFILNIIDHLLY